MSDNGDAHEGASDVSFLYFCCFFIFVFQTDKRTMGVSDANKQCKGDGTGDTHIYGNHSHNTDADVPTHSIPIIDCSAEVVGWNLPAHTPVENAATSTTQSGEQELCVMCTDGRVAVVF
jgi:hypothetical protein